MKRIEDVEKYDLVRVINPINNHFPKGSIVRVTEINSDIVHSDNIISLSQQRSISLRKEDFHFYFEVIENETDINIKLNYSLGVDDKGNAIFIDKRINEIPRTSLTFEELSKLFKYIPIDYKGNLGFYYNGNIIVKKTITKEKKKSYVKYDPNGRPIGVKPWSPPKVITNTIIQFIPIDTKDVSKYYSDKPLLNLCKIRIIGYEKSSKLFAYSGEKKELLNRTLQVHEEHNKDEKVKELRLDIIEVKLNDQVKKSDQLQNTIAINGQTRKLRFVWDELEIIYPNINSWKPTKAAIIKEGFKVKIKDNRSLRSFKRDDIVVISNVKKVGNKKYAGFIHDNKLYYDNIKNFKILVEDKK